MNGIHDSTVRGDCPVIVTLGSASVSLAKWGSIPFSPRGVGHTAADGSEQASIPGFRPATRHGWLGGDPAADVMQLADRQADHFSGDAIQLLAYRAIRFP